ncbi:MAG: lamin tail domain-containing protein [Methanomassiliicoccales archaeon]
MLAGASAIFMMRLEGKRSSLTSSEIQTMVQEGDKIAIEFEQEVIETAIKACSSFNSINATLLQEKFSEDLQDEISRRYPKNRNEMEINLSSTKLHIDYLRLSLNRTKNTEIQNKNLWAFEGAPCYLSVGGNYEIFVKRKIDNIILKREIEKRIWFPIPLLQDRMQDFNLALTSPKGRFDRIVQYELTSLAQMRILQGFGIAGKDGPFGTSEIITHDDIQRAVGLAVIFLQIECFGAFDKNSAKAVLDRFPVQISVQEFEELLSSAEKVDPADIFLMLLGANHFDAEKVLAQVILSMADIITLSWLDYFQILDIGEDLERIYTDSLVGLNQVLAEYLGQDRINQLSQEWIQNKLISYGLEESSYRWLNMDNPDATIVFPNHEFYLSDQQGNQIQLFLGGEYLVDFPTIDVITNEVWKEFIIDYRRATFDLAESIKRFIQKIAINMANGFGLGEIILELDFTDSRTFYFEAKSNIRRAMESAFLQLDKIIDSIVSENIFKDPLAESMVQFIKNKMNQIVRTDFCVESALDELASRLVRSQLDKTMYLDAPTIDLFSQNLANLWKFCGHMGARQGIEEAYIKTSQPIINLYLEVFGNATINEMPCRFDQAISLLAKGCIHSIPGIKEILLQACERMFEDQEQALLLRCDETKISIPSREIRIDTGYGAVARQQLLPEVNMPWIMSSYPLFIKLENPFSIYSGGNGSNLHLTNPDNLTFSAYQSSFSLLVKGNLSVKVKCSGGSSNQISFFAPLEVNSESAFGFKLDFTSSSAWPLAGVKYSPSITFIKSIAQIFEEIWKNVCSAFCWIADVAEEVFSFFQDLVNRVMGYATKFIQDISELLLSFIQNISDMLDGALGSFIGWLKEKISSQMQSTSISFEFGGLQFILDFGSTTIFLGQSKEFLRVTMITRILGGKMSVSACFVDVYRSGPDLIINMSFSGKGWESECLIDPRMAVINHFAELKGVFSDFIVEIKLPVLVSYDKKSFRLSEIPGLGQLLSRIPLPIPGISASIDAGFEIKYRSSINNHPLINEVELNPCGEDRGHEWIELYNPSSNVIDVRDWCIRSVHGHQTVMVLDFEIMPPKSRKIIEFKVQSLDNGGENGIPIGESLGLYDAEGRKIDSTPFITDFLNDEKTWQRAYDGSDRWVLKDETKGEPNGVILSDLSDSQRLLILLKDAVIRAFTQFGNELFDINSLGRIIENAIKEVVDTIIQTIYQSILELNLFIELAIHDYTQSIDGKLRLTLVVTGDGVRDGLIWLAKTIYSALANIGNPGAISASTHRPLNEFTDDIYIRFGAFAGTGLPKIISSVSESRRFMFGGVIEVNLATFTASLEDRQKCRLRFGALFEAIPGSFIKNLYSVDADCLVDYWILKAEISSRTAIQQNTEETWSL